MNQLSGMVLAAGRGARLEQAGEPLPKPLIKVGGEVLALTALTRLRRAGAVSLRMNLHHRAAEIQSFLQPCAEDVLFLPEPKLLDTGGGIRAALPHLGEVFFISTCDGRWADEKGAAALLGRMAKGFNPVRHDACLLLGHHHRAFGCGNEGDFSLSDEKNLSRAGKRDFIYSGAAILSAGFFANIPSPVFPLAPLLFEAAAKQRLSGAVLESDFFHAGTVEGLAKARQFFAKG